MHIKKKKSAPDKLHIDEFWALVVMTWERALKVTQLGRVSGWTDLYGQLPLTPPTCAAVVRFLKRAEREPLIWNEMLADMDNVAQKRMPHRCFAAVLISETVLLSAGNSCFFHTSAAGVKAIPAGSV